MKKYRRFPAEWESQSAIQLTWPHVDTDWAPYLEAANQCFLEIAAAVTQYQLLIVVSPNTVLVANLLESKGINMDRVRMVETATNDTWARDHGAISIIENGQPLVVDFKFNGWGLKFPSNHDNLITRKLLEDKIFDSSVGYENQLNFAFEGGGIESDGKGTLMTTSECLLSPNRNGGFTKAEVEHYLLDALGAERMLWIDHGYLAGDDTDSHVDTLVRFCDENTIVYVQCTDKDDEHYEQLNLMEKQVLSFVTPSGTPYKCVPLPMADLVLDEDGYRIPATYANFTIINGAVLLPFYNSEKDVVAQRILQEVFPDRAIIGIDCSILIQQHGSLHCVTMQYPENFVK